MRERMNENTKIENNSMIEIDIKRIWKAIWSRFWIVCLSAILCAIISLTGTVLFITPTYQSSAMFYVNNNSLSVGDASFSLTSSDITAAKSLVDTYIVILKSRACLNEVIDYTDSDLSYSELRSMISAAAVNSTEIFEIEVTSPDPEEAEVLANAIAYILPKRISSIVEGTSANIVDYAVKASSPSSPSYSKNTMLGIVVGLFFSVAIISIREIFDITIRNEEDVERCCQHPILASVPDMNIESSKSGYYYGYGSSGKKRNASNEKATIIGKDISFSASEAYKLLRTKLQFSFVDEVNCPVIGVSSALAGEGKSLSSINLAFSLAQLDKKVLLIDCDMRRPSIELKLKIQKVPGLSNYLTGQNDMGEVIQMYRADSEECFDVIAAGINPPNPIELLSSAKMKKAIAAMRNSYDYIIIDLPPVGEVSDAMVAANLVDGILLVVRQDYCNTAALSNAVSQFEFIESRILGVVMNCVNEYSGKYKKYYKKYYSSYAGSYAREAAKVKSISHESKHGKK